MKISRKKHSDSLFNRYFIQITATVLSCLTLTSFAVLFFSVGFWKTDRLTSLKDDALSLTQSVNSILEEDSGAFDETDIRTKELVSHLLTTVARSAASEIYLIDSEGKIMMCYDAGEEGKNNGSDFLCTIHESYVFEPEMLHKIQESDQEYFEYKGRVDRQIKEDYFMVAVPLTINGEDCFIAAMQAESVAYLPYTTAFLRILITVGIIAVVISFIVSFTVSLRMARPLKIITEATNHYASGDFSVRIKASEVYNELSELVDAVNKMADSLSVLEASRSSFVANVSHELKTPMTTISGFIDGILDGTVAECDIEKYLRIVSDEVKRLSRLVVAMLNMSKIEAGKLELNNSDFDISRLFTKTLLGFEKIIDEKDISVLGCEALEKITVNADEALINQVIYNLIDNAVKFTPHGGIISISLSSDKKDAIFSIRNTGKGISKEDMSLIFDRFYKVDKSRGLDAKSFGMGLYIVKSIIELHHGTINISSEEGMYTEFTIRLPLA